MRSAHGTGALALGLLIALSACSSHFSWNLPKGPEQKAQFQPIKRSSFDEQQGVYRAEVTGSAERAFSRQKDIRFRYVCMPDASWSVEREDDGDAYLATIEIPGHMSNPNFADIESVFELYDGIFRDAEKAYARFQDYRALHSEISHDKMALRLAVQQGLTVLYYARILMDIHEGIARLGCSVNYMKRPMKTLEGMLEDVSSGQLPGLMAVLKQSLDNWTYNLVQLEFDVLVGRDVIQQCHQWWDELSSGENIYDTPILTWCGYALARQGRRDAALAFWRKAGQTVHDPQMANFALASVREMEKLGKNTDKVRRATRDE
jgi:hypothetical protein